MCWLICPGLFTIQHAHYTFSELLGIARISILAVLGELDGGRRGILTAHRRDLALLRELLCMYSRDFIHTVRECVRRSADCIFHFIHFFVYFDIMNCFQEAR
jgi:hypothetical protein